MKKKEIWAVEIYDCLPALNLSHQIKDVECNICFYVADGSEDTVREGLFLVETRSKFVHSSLQST